MSEGNEQIVRGKWTTSRAAAMQNLNAGLYIVATPIGNADDITLRAISILNSVTIIACEDTRVTRKLLNLYDISTPLTTYHEHNAKRVRPALIKRIKHGDSIALVSDAGTPLISDPGYKLVRGCLDESLAVSSIPGPSAPISALVISGLPTDRFLFAGFLPTRKVARTDTLRLLRYVPASLIFMESARRLPTTLVDMQALLGPRSGVVAREITKQFEEVKRGTLDTLARHYSDNGPPKGEVMLVVGPPDVLEIVTDKSLDLLLQTALVQQSLRDAVTHVASITGKRRAEVYRRALKITQSKC